MLSKIAERIYWMSRYIERVENTARLVKVHSNLIYDLPKEIQLNWYSLIEIFDLEENYTGNKTETACMQFLLIDRDNPSSLVCSLLGVRENLRTTRDTLPKEAWHMVNGLYLMFKRKEQDCLIRSKRNELMDEIIAVCQQINGMFSGLMSRGIAYRFLLLGRNLERADMSSRLLDEGGIYLNHPTNDPIWVEYHKSVWSNLLKATGGFFMYRQHVQKTIDGESTIEFILKNPDFPKSIFFCWQQVKQVILTFDINFKEFGKLDSKMKRTMNHKLYLVPNSPELRNLIDNIQVLIAKCNDLFYQYWFNPSLDKKK